MPARNPDKEPDVRKVNFQFVIDGVTYQDVVYEDGTTGRRIVGSEASNKLNVFVGESAVTIFGKDGDNHIEVKTSPDADADADADDDDDEDADADADNPAQPGSVSIDSGIGDDYVSTGDGDDFIISRRGDDKVHSGGGDDQILARPGDDLVHAGAGNDRVHGGEGNDTIYGEAGNDKLTGARGDDKVHGGDGDDRVNGGGGNDIVTGGNGNDVLFGSDGDDSLDGGAGDDSLAGGLGKNRLTGGEGNDTFVLYSFGIDKTSKDEELSGKNLSEKHTILDFAQGEDKLEILSTSTYVISQVSNEDEIPVDTEILIDGTALVILEGFTDTLTESDFSLVTLEVV